MSYISLLLLYFSCIFSVLSISADKILFKNTLIKNLNNCQKLFYKASLISISLSYLIWFFDRIFTSNEYHTNLFYLFDMAHMQDAPQRLFFIAFLSAMIELITTRKKTKLLSKNSTNAMSIIFTGISLNLISINAFNTIEINDYFYPTQYYSTIFSYILASIGVGFLLQLFKLSFIQIEQKTISNEIIPTIEKTALTSWLTFAVSLFFCSYWSSIEIRQNSIWIWKNFQSNIIIISLIITTCLHSWYIFRQTQSMQRYSLIVGLLLFPISALLTTFDAHKHFPIVFALLGIALFVAIYKNYITSHPKKQGIDPKSIEWFHLLSIVVLYTILVAIICIKILSLKFSFEIYSDACFYSCIFAFVASLYMFCVVKTQLLSEQKNYVYLTLICALSFLIIGLINTHYSHSQKTMSLLKGEHKHIFNKYELTFVDREVKQKDNYFAIEANYILKTINGATVKDLTPQKRKYFYYPVSAERPANFNLGTSNISIHFISPDEEGGYITIINVQSTFYFLWIALSLLIVAVLIICSNTFRKAD